MRRLGRTRNGPPGRSVFIVVNGRPPRRTPEGRSAGTPAELPWPRGGFDHSASTLLATAAGIGSLVLGTVVGRLVFDNAYGPFGSFGPLGDLPRVIGTSTAYAFGATLGIAAFASTRWLARRSRVALLIFIAVMATAGWTLYPQRMEVSQFDERVACTGVTFLHYPPGTTDGWSTQYCVGSQESIVPAWQPCQEMVARIDAMGWKVALGYASTEYKFGQSGELRLCLRGMSGMTATVTTDPGIEVMPASIPVQVGQEVLRFTVRVQPKAHGAIRFEVRYKGGATRLNGLFGPTIQSTGSGWRITASRTWPAN